VTETVTITFATVAVARKVQRRLRTRNIVASQVDRVLRVYVPDTLTPTQTRETALALAAPDHPS